jgi:hypothetical protein
MPTNTTVLIIVAIMAALLLAGMLVVVVCKTRAQQRHGKSPTIRDQSDKHALQLRHQEALADESATRSHAALGEIDVKTAEADSLQRQATAYRSEAVTSRDQLNEVRVHRLAG